MSAGYQKFNEMALDIQQERREAHELIDRLPDSQVSAVLGFLAFVSRREREQESELV